MALNPCVREILCALGQASLAAITPILDSQIAALNAQKAVILSQLVALDVASLPVQAANGVAQRVLADVRAIGNLVPLQLVSGCADLGDLNTGLNTALDVVAAEAVTITEDLSRLLSFSEELNAINDEFDELITLFEDIKQEIETCFV